MKISEVRVKLVDSQINRLRAFCSITVDNEFVVRDIKVIEGSNGYFVAMPSRKMTERCENCGGKNHLRAKFCCSCGDNISKKPTIGHANLYSDIAHPITADCREQIHASVLNAFTEEMQRSQQPGYIPVELDDLDNDNL